MCICSWQWNKKTRNSRTSCSHWTSSLMKVRLCRRTLSAYPSLFRLDTLCTLSCKIHPMPNCTILFWGERLNISIIETLDISKCFVVICWESVVLFSPKNQSTWLSLAVIAFVRLEGTCIGRSIMFLFPCLILLINPRCRLQASRSLRQRFDGSIQMTCLNVGNAKGYSILPQKRSVRITLLSQDVALTLSLPSSKSTFSQPFEGKCIGDERRIGCIIISHPSNVWNAKFFILFNVISRWGCRRNLKLITLGSERVKVSGHKTYVFCHFTSSLAPLWSLWEDLLWGMLLKDSNKVHIKQSPPCVWHVPHKFEQRFQIDILWCQPGWQSDVRETCVEFSQNL